MDPRVYLDSVPADRAGRPGLIRGCDPAVAIGTGGIDIRDRGEVPRDELARGFRDALESGR